MRHSHINIQLGILTFIKIKFNCTYDTINTRTQNRLYNIEGLGQEWHFPYFLGIRKLLHLIL